ncbi:MAG: hypothetical protein UT55_C0072G0012 [Candidatus Peregrinibacteria bacterium GW2011_GWE2_39_6]|nr:MAG: hypothetical protein UT36_C0006G0069 [Candidatus Peregrinibacteria bacterium GW2011_GWF2_39_17]KKR24114.1 MAG: hypothetical protein UT55_C0072G0012 [Candidatus Peregrinibacteria bacterium GW2011_GWE2_39_6]HCW32769.1 hypothetical protein [Candidatus Peregrinibacteria bacterium]
MNFSELKRLLKELKSVAPCRECGHIFEDTEINVVGTLHDQGFFVGHCPVCQHDLLINVHVQARRPAHRSISKRGPSNSPSLKPITQNEILDLCNFLKDFNGDFSSLFSKQ